MRTKIMLYLGIIILLIFNYAIYKQEHILKNGSTLFLELAPVDPRSLMQGDYMILRYTLERTVPRNQINYNHGHIVVKANTHNVLQFQRLYKNETLSKDEHLIQFRKKNRRIELIPNTFLFQEGHRKFYDEARYGVFKFLDQHNYLLVGLADKNRTIIVAHKKAMEKKLKSAKNP